nr:replication associated protein [Flumine microvirus 30]
MTAWRGPVLPSGKRGMVFKPSESTGGLCALPQKLPCGQCIGCRLDYSLDWAYRCLCEAQMHKENSFVTLTYDEFHLPSDGSLNVGEWQLFIKRLRRSTGKKIRYYHAGEYGERFGRPHYHGLLFGHDFADKQLFKRSESGSNVYISEVLSGVWGKGFASVGEVTFESAAYVARYCMKKLNGPAKEVVDARTGLKPYERFDGVTGEVLPVRSEYVTMSRRPGIAKSWFERYRDDVYPSGCVVFRGGRKMPPPRYFDGLYELDNPVDMKRLKMLRYSRSNRREDVFSDVLQKVQSLEVNRWDRLEDMELVKERQLSVCRRKVESGL